jgi:hypothetical protein
MFKKYDAHETAFYKLWNLGGDIIIAVAASDTPSRRVCGLSACSSTGFLARYSYYLYRGAFAYAAQVAISGECCLSAGPNSHFTAVNRISGLPL